VLLELALDDSGAVCNSALLSALPLCARLCSLSVTYRALSDAWLAAAVAALPACTQLTGLVLDHCSLPAGLDLIQLVSALVRCPSLITLEARDTPLGMRAVCALCCDISACAALRRLCLIRVGLDEVSAVVVLVLSLQAPRVNVQLEL